jgi:hypothetical protein
MKGNVENLPRSGRPPKVTKRAESRLLRLVRSNRERSLRDHMISTLEV